MTTITRTRHALQSAAVQSPARTDDESRERGASLLATTTARLEVLAGASFDGRADTRVLEVFVPDNADNAKRVQDRIALSVRTANGVMTLGFTDHAHRQMADRLGVTGSYWTTMLDKAPALAAYNANWWLRNDPAKRLLRMVRPTTADDEKALGTIGAHARLRAFLSDGYRAVDHYDLVEQVLPVVRSSDAWMTEANVGEQHMHLRFVTSGVDVMRVAGAPRAVGEWVRFGFSLRNSEVGVGAIAVVPWAEVLRCTNGLVVAEEMRQRHVGGRGNGEESDYMADDTRRVDDASVLLKVRDRVVEALSDGAQRRAAKLIAAAAAEPITLPSDLPSFEFVENVGKRWKLNDTERRVLAEEFTRETATSPLGPDVTKWALTQAMTATARRTKGDDFARGLELETAGFEILTSAGERLRAAGLGGAKR